MVAGLCVCTVSESPSVRGWQAKREDKSFVDCGETVWRRGQNDAECFVRRGPGDLLAVMWLVTAATLVCLLVPSGAQQEDEDQGNQCIFCCNYGAWMLNVADLNGRVTNRVRVEAAPVLRSRSIRAGTLLSSGSLLDAFFRLKMCHSDPRGPRKQTPRCQFSAVALNM